MKVLPLAGAVVLRLSDSVDRDLRLDLVGHTSLVMCLSTIFKKNYFNFVQLSVTTSNFKQQTRLLREKRTTRGIAPVVVKHQLQFLRHVLLFIFFLIRLFRWHEHKKTLYKKITFQKVRIVETLRPFVCIPYVCLIQFQISDFEYEYLENIAPKSSMAFPHFIAIPSKFR